MPLALLGVTRSRCHADYLNDVKWLLTHVKQFWLPLGTLLRLVLSLRLEFWVTRLSQVNLWFTQIDVKFLLLKSLPVINCAALIKANSVQNLNSNLTRWRLHHQDLVYLLASQVNWCLRASFSKVIVSPTRAIFSSSKACLRNPCSFSIFRLRNGAKLQFDPLQRATLVHFTTTQSFVYMTRSSGQDHDSSSLSISVDPTTDQPALT